MDNFHDDKSKMTQMADAFKQTRLDIKRSVTVLEKNEPSQTFKSEIHCLKDGKNKVTNYDTSNCQEYYSQFEDVQQPYLAMNKIRMKNNLGIHSVEPENFEFYDFFINEIKDKKSSKA